MASPRAQHVDTARLRSCSRMRYTLRSYLAAGFLVALCSCVLACHAPTPSLDNTATQWCALNSDAVFDALGALASYRRFLQAYRMESRSLTSQLRANGRSPTSPKQVLVSRKSPDQRHRPHARNDNYEGMAATEGVQPTHLRVTLTRGQLAWESIR